MISAIVIASGLSRRAGQNKLLLDLDGKTVIERVLKTVTSYGFSDKLLVAKDEEIIAFGNKYDFRIIHNKMPEHGQSESVKLGVLNAKNALSYMFFAGDQPFITTQLIETLITAHEDCNGKITVPVSNGKKGNPVIFPRTYKNDLLNLNGDNGGREIIKKCHNMVRYVEIDEDINFFDIDTMSDYEYAKHWLKP